MWVSRRPVASTQARLRKALLVDEPFVRHVAAEALGEDGRVE